MGCGRVVEETHPATGKSLRLNLLDGFVRLAAHAPEHPRLAQRYILAVLGIDAPATERRPESTLGRHRKRRWTVVLIQWYGFRIIM